MSTHIFYQVKYHRSTKEEKGNLVLQFSFPSGSIFENKIKSLKMHQKIARNILKNQEYRKTRERQKIWQVTNT